MQKLLALTAVLLVASLLLGCGKAQDKPAPATAEQQEQKPAPKPEPAEEPAETAEAPEEEAASEEPAEPLGECPDTKVEALDSSSDSYKASGPFDLAAMTVAKAQSSKEGARVKVFISNKDFTVTQMANTFVSPIKNKDEAILVISFSNGKDKVVIGEYDPANGYGKPFWVSAEVRVLGTTGKGTDISFGAKEGKAVILDMKDGKICGTFDLTGSLGSAKGTFTADLEVK